MALINSRTSETHHSFLSYMAGALRKQPISFQLRIRDVLMGTHIEVHRPRDRLLIHINNNVSVIIKILLLTFILFILSFSKELPSKLTAT